MIALIALGGVSAVILVLWALCTARREPNLADWPDRRGHHEEIVTTAGRAATRA